MSNYNSALQSNNTDLQAILNTINELPDAGGSDNTAYTVYIGTSEPTADMGADGDIFIVRSDTV